MHSAAHVERGNPVIKKEVAEQVLASALASGGDFAEIFCEDTLTNTVAMIDGKVDQLNGGRTYGAGIRIFKGLKSVYAYTNDLSLSGLVATAKKAAAVIGELSGDGAIEIQLAPSLITSIHPIEIIPSSVVGSKKVEVLRKLHLSAKGFSDEISQVMARLSDVDQKVLIANSRGLYTEDRRIRTRILGQAIASNGTENQVGYEAPGRHMGFEMFSEVVDVEALGRTAAETAVTMLHAKACPAGRMPVAIDNAFGGVIFHEACGHSLEATSVAKGTSEFSGKLGQQIASTIVTAIDDGTIPNGWGSQMIDDEGQQTRKNVLIENGILKSYLIDELNGRRMGMAATGSSRRESYKYAPTSRMTNTYIAAGDSSDDEIIASMAEGLYAKKLGGGSVNPATGEFNFAVLEGYMVKNGAIQEPVRGASLIGKGSEVLMKIDMVGRNLEHGTGMCGSSSGNIPTFVGQPMVRVSDMIVGGK